PIQLYADYRRCEQRPATLDGVTAARALERIILGFFKVAIVSPLLIYALQRLNGHLTIANTALWIALIPVYVYVNFSGYMDFVIGVARFLRLDLPENFNRPFLATGFIEFWTRWHITLSNWLKMYVY